MQWTNAAIAWPLTLVKPAETLALDWLNTERATRKGDLINHLAEHHLHKKYIKQNNKQNAKKQNKHNTIS